MRRDAVPTPSLVLDLDALERNVATMVARAKEAGVGLRCHAKSHKSVDVARLLRRAGALGPACATIQEAETMAAGGLDGILITSPMVTPDALEKVEKLLLRGADLLLVVDDPANLDALGALADAIGRTLKLIVELDVGVGRTGCRDIAGAVDLAERIDGDPRFEFAGIQAYWGHLQQVVPIEDRVRRVQEQVERTRELIEALKKAGRPPRIVTGSGTGTSWIDSASGIFTELQPGSFLFLDSCYGTVPITPDGKNPFEPSLFVAAGVVSANHPGRAVTNAGWKALAADSGKPVPKRGAPQGATYRFMGDEHGAVEHEAGSLPGPGAVIELLTSHCDPTVNLHRQYHVVRGDQVVDIWPIGARGY
ncbi:MAG: DSD1 family PLP-dependent enzyme [Geminicoccaceae bacterium]